MNPDSDNFDPLRRLLTLKRHEAPPPRYFNDFSSQVINRIKAGERGESIGVAGLFGLSAWLQRIWAAFESRPVVTGIFGAAVCGLLVSGIISEESSTTVPVSIGPVGSVASEATSPQVGQSATLAVSQPLEPTGIQPQMVSSTNPIAPSLNNLFDQFQPRAFPASLSVQSGQN